MCDGKYEVYSTVTEVIVTVQCVYGFGGLAKPCLACNPPVKVRATASPRLF